MVCLLRPAWPRSNEMLQGRSLACRMRADGREPRERRREPVAALMIGAFVARTDLPVRRRSPRRCPSNRPCRARSSLTATGVGQPISRATISPSSRIASGWCEHDRRRRVAGMHQFQQHCRGRRRADRARQEQHLAGDRSRRIAGCLTSAMRPLLGSTPPQKLIGAVSTSASPAPAAPGDQHLGLQRLHVREAHAASSLSTGRPATALSTQSASEP